MFFKFFANVQKHRVYKDRFYLFKLNCYYNTLNLLHLFKKLKNAIIFMQRSNNIAGVHTHFSINTQSMRVNNETQVPQVSLEIVLNLENNSKSLKN